MPGDYNGDGMTEIAVYTPGEFALWWIQGQPSFTMWGSTGDIPVPADYDGDGATDVAVFTPEEYGLWWIVGQPSFTMWGTTDDIPLTGRP